MSIIQAIIGTNLTISGGAPPPPPPPTPDGQYYSNETLLTWGSVGLGQSKPSYNASYSYPDNTTVAPIWDFNGTDQLMTTQATDGYTQIYMNLWFYPTAAGRIIMCIQGQLTENVGYTHAALEIAANQTVIGAFWAGINMVSVTTANSVTLNAWNHIYFRQNANQILLQLNGGTAVTANNTWAYPATLVVAFGATSISNTAYSARFQGSLAEFRMNSTNTASNYDSTRSKYEAPQEFLYDDFTIEWWQKAEAIGVNTRPFAIGLLGTLSGQVVSLSYEGNGRDYFWINNSFPAQLADRPLKNHYGIGWEHMAIVRKDNVIKLFSNGTSYLTWSGGNQAITATNADLVVGTGEIPTGNFQGWIKDLHIIKGYAKYNANFSVPVLPVQPQTGSVFLLSAMTSGTAFDDVVSYKTATLTNTPTYSEDDPFTYPGATFTALGYGDNLITPSPMPADLRVGLLVSDGAGWSDYVIDPNYFGNIKLSSLPASTPPELVYTVSEDLTSVTQGTNTYGGNNPANYGLDYSSTNFNVELLKVRKGWTVIQGETILGTVRANAFLITPEVIRIGVDFDPATGSGLTFTYLPPTYGGSVRFDAGDYINYGSSVDWAFDVDGINTGSITLDLDANNTTSYSGTGTTWTDLSGLGNNATLLNTPYWDNGPPGYFNFDGVNQYATVAGANIIPAAAYSKMVWFKIDTFSADNNLVSSDNGGHFMYFNQTNTLYAGHSNVFPYNAFGSTFHFSTDTWYCAVVTFSVANGIKLYINGVLDASDPSFQTPHNQNGNTNIACFGIGGNFLNGKIGRILCYGKELTSGEVLQNFEATRNRYGI